MPGVSCQSREGSLRSPGSLFLALHTHFPLSSNSICFTFFKNTSLDLVFDFKINEKGVDSQREKAH